MTKYLVVALLFIIAAVFFFAESKLPFLRSIPTPIPQVVEEQKSAVVEVVDREQTKSYPSVEYKEGATALDLTRSVAQVKTKREGEMAFVISINDRMADEKEKEYWSFLVNGEIAEVGAGSYTVQNRDTITWKIQTY